MAVSVESKALPADTCTVMARLAVRLASDVMVAVVEPACKPVTSSVRFSGLKTTFAIDGSPTTGMTMPLAGDVRLADDMCPRSTRTEAGLTTTGCGTAGVGDGAYVGFGPWADGNGCATGEGEGVGDDGGSGESAIAETFGRASMTAAAVAARNPNPMAARSCTATYAMRCCSSRFTAPARSVL